MEDKEWHRDRIDELKFKINQKNEDYQRNLFIFGALLSATLILFIFELQKELKHLGWILILGLLIILEIGILTRNPPSLKEENRKIRNNYSALLKIRYN
jgi:hypothetical protein